MLAFINHKYHSELPKAKQSLNSMWNKIESARTTIATEKLKANQKQYFDIKNAIESGQQLIELLTNCLTDFTTDFYHKGYKDGAKYEKEIQQVKTQNKYENPEAYRIIWELKVKEKWSELY